MHQFSTQNNQHKIWLTDFCETMRIFISIVMIQIVVIIYALSFLSFDMQFLQKLSILTLLAQFFGLTILVILCKLRPFLNRLHVSSGVFILSLLIILISTFLTKILSFLDTRFFLYLMSNHSFINHLDLKLSVSSVLIFLGLIRYFYIQDQWNNQIKKLSEARLNALQARIKPHFLFNSLNSITSLISIDAQRAETAIIDFSGLMRQAFSHKEQDITVAEELSWVKDYLSIEKLRLADRLSYQINCEPELLQKKIPTLCLQPLVENAVIHGIQPIEIGGNINVSITKCESKLRITVSNPYQIIEAKNTSNGMALKNINERLQLQYGSNAYMHITQDNNIFTVQLELPL